MTAISGEQIRQWLIAHEESIDFSEAGFMKRTIKANKEDWEMFYVLLGKASEANRFVAEPKQ